MSFKRNKMQFVEFQHQFAHFPIFSLKDVKKAVDRFSTKQINRWKAKGYLKEIKREFYCFASQDIDPAFLWYAANKIYTPSYVSLETALKHYGLIPEEVFQVTSVSTKKTAHFETQIGNFTYKSIKPKLYFGYTLIEIGGKKFLLAELEKAILDFLYIHSDLKTVADFEEIRINMDELRQKIDLTRFKKYLENFKNKRLSQRANVFLKMIVNDPT